MLAAQELKELPALVLLLDDPVADVGTVEARDEYAGGIEPQPLEDLAASEHARGGREGDARHAGKALVQHGKLQVFRPEVMPPLRHAVRFVDGEKRETAVREEAQAAFRQQPLGRDVKQIELALSRRALDLRRLARAQRRVEERRAHAEL